MANPEHVERLLEGAEAWNGWRAANPNIRPDLSGQVIDAALFQGLCTPANTNAFNFSRADLSHCEFIDIALQGADFTSATLRETSFGHGSSLTDSKFDNAAFSNTSFEHCHLVRCAFQASPDPVRAVSFRRAHCENCLFGGAFDAVPFDLGTIEHSYFTEAELRACTFINTVATRCNFVDAQLIDTSAVEARFIACDFRGASFTSADLFGAELTESDLRGAQGYNFDDNLARRIVLTTEASDYWSILRRAYTGARFGFNAVFLLVFFLPIIVRAVFWTELAQVENSAPHLQSELRKIADTLAAFPYPGVAQLATTLHNLAGAGLCGARHCVTVPVVLLFVGWPAKLEASGILGYFALIVGVVAGPALIIYNALRGLLTFFVLPMRDEEMRSGHTPRWRWGDARLGPGQRGIIPPHVGFFERLPGVARASTFFIKLRSRYGWLVPLHRTVQVLAYVAYAASAVHFARLLFLAVSLPG
jgi:uncharacterized protein YjbI with pentapeptide repeats